MARPGALHLVISALHELCARIADAEREGAQEAEIRAVTEAAREVHLEAPFGRRLQTWPRGYPGDFETIEYILAQQVRAEPGTLAAHLERYMLDTPLAQQHRNKVTAQAQEILRAVRGADTRRPARVLVLACGSAPDVASIRHDLVESSFELVLVDQDEAALALSQRRLDETLGARVRYERGNVLRVGPRLARERPFDLVLAGGLFDYLDDRWAAALMKTIAARLVRPGGRFFFTNIKESNPYRVWTEFCADWPLIERSEPDIRRVVSEAFGPGHEIELRTDRTGLAWLTTVHAAAETHPVPPAV